MLFNSYEFIFLFLPITAIIYFLLGQYRLFKIAKVWLILASLFFYGWWETRSLLLICCSILFNFTMGRCIASQPRQASTSRVLLFVGVSCNIALLGYFKYSNFISANFNWLAGGSFKIESLILPLAISFFTLQQIAYLVDVYKGEAPKYSFIHYTLFVTFFPHLIAGPIVHHRDLIPQFEKDSRFRLQVENVAIGLTLFSFGLFKKIVIADTFATMADPMFNQALLNGDIHFIDAWCAAIAYTFQIYYDFSAYSEMAIGLSYILGISLVLNFDSPYKATSMIDHWTRWHITLSRFFRTYVYIPLGGNRKGKLRRYINLFITTFLSGLWHGANWNFVLWGVLHGVYLIINHTWRDLKEKLGIKWNDDNFIYQWSCRLLTFAAVVFSLACFRSDGFNVVFSVAKAMFNVGDFSIGHYYEIAISQINIVTYIKPLILGLSPLTIVFTLLAITSLWVWLMPNVIALMHNHPVVIGQQPVEIARRHWSPTIGWSTIAALLATIAIINLATVSKFIYFQF